ncbi:alpha/beta fold hydrolase [Amycolatopsis nigrescens]|uniref:alpha/beta fold hydrolase n=1 Tax=Amycolatopsis nigrescens TaxID=381445 RepID=UPI00037441DB|nr:alpha/beta hydrolase [Amycolatopsis nigrescens]
MTAIQSGPARTRRGAALSWDPATEHRFVTADGTALHFTAEGPADAPVTLVLVHGWTQDHRTWARVAGAVPRLTGPVRVLSYDLRGHGGSAPARPGTATIEQLADDLAELIGELAPTGPLVLAGHSMGGMTIMALAERHPQLVADRVAAAAFVGTSSGQMNRITLGLPGLAGSGAARIERRIAKVLARQRRDALPLTPAMVRPGARFLVFGKKPRREDLNSVAEQVLCAHPASVAGFQDAISKHDRRVALGALRGTPAVVLAGERDRLCPLPHAKAIAEALPDAEFVRFPGAGHMLPQERDHEVTKRIAALVRIAAPSGK